MLKSQMIEIAQIYVPAKWRDTLDEAKVEEIAESIIDVGQKTPIQVRKGKGRFVLIAGYHRLEALKALGESKIEALIVQARQH